MYCQNYKKGNTMSHFDTTLLFILENVEKSIAALEKILSSDIKSPKSRFAELAKKENLDLNPQTLYAYLSNFDPTPKSTYVPWIASIFKNSGVDLPEDQDRIKIAINKFLKGKNSPAFQSSKNLFDYKTLGQLEVAVKDISLEDSAPASRRSWNKLLDDLKPQLFKTIYEDRIYKVLKISKSGQSYESIKFKTKNDTASLYNYIPAQFAGAIDKDNVIFVGQLDLSSYVVADFVKNRSSWCVANTETAERYLNKGPLYIVMKEGNLFFLANYNWLEVMDPGTTGTQLPLALPSNYTLILLIRLLQQIPDEFDSKAQKNIAHLISRREPIIKKQAEKGQLRQQVANDILNSIEEIKTKYLS